MHPWAASAPGPFPFSPPAPEIFFSRSDSLRVTSTPWASGGAASCARRLRTTTRACSSGAPRSSMPRPSRPQASAAHARRTRRTRRSARRGTSSRSRATIRCCSSAKVRAPLTRQLFLHTLASTGTPQPPAEPAARDQPRHRGTGVRKVPRRTCDPRRDPRARRAVCGPRAGVRRGRGRTAQVRGGHGRQGRRAAPVEQGLVRLPPRRYVAARLTQARDTRTSSATCSRTSCLSCGSSYRLRRT